MIPPPYEKIMTELHHHHDSQKSAWDSLWIHKKIMMIPANHHGFYDDFLEIIMTLTMNSMMKFMMIMGFIYEIHPIIMGFHMNSHDDL